MDPSLVVATTSGDYRITSSIDTTIPFAADTTDTAPSDIGNEILETGPLHGQRTTRPGNRRLFSLKHNRTAGRAGNVGFAGNLVGGRMFDYDQKYAIDEWGAEMGPESRFCKMYVDETEIYDMERIESWRDVLDVLLVFIGLFSAIVTTFVIQTSQALQPDYGQLTATLVYNLVLVQRALSNGTITSVPLPVNPDNHRVSPSQIEKWVNGLWFTSLAISLSTALVTVLTKQWLYHYMSQTSGTSKDRVRLRQFRFAGLEKYRVPMIIDLLPVALHLALALFLVGLVIFLYSLDHVMAAVVIVISGIAYIFYIASAVLPLFDPQCPYQSPISSYLHLFHVLSLHLMRTVDKAATSAAFRCIGYCSLLQSFMIRKLHLHDTNIFLPLVHWLYKHEDSFAFPPSTASLQTEERRAVLRHGDQLDVDAIAWLLSTSSNATVRNIAFHAVIGLNLSDADTTTLDAEAGLYHSAITDDISSYNRQECSMVSFRALVGRYIVPQLDGPLTDQEGYRVFNTLIVPTLNRLSKSRFFDPGQGTDLVTLGHFLPPGPHADLRLPISIWRLCVKNLVPLPLHLSVVSFLVQHALNRPIGEAPLYPSTFELALKKSEHLYSLLVQVVATHLGFDPDQVQSVYSVSFLHAIIFWVVPHLEASAEDVEFECALERKKTAMDILADCFELYDHLRLQGVPMDSDDSDDSIYEKLRDACACTLVHELASDNTTLWTRRFNSIDFLVWLWGTRPTIPCPPALLESLRGLPYQSLASLVSTIIMNCPTDLGLFYDMLRESDVMPLAEIGELYLGIYPWSFHLSRVAVFRVRGQMVDTTTEWAIRWIEYIDCPERLFFIFSCLSTEFDDDSTLLAQVTPLLDLTRTSSHWATCFHSLIGLLGNANYINSLRANGCTAPYHALSLALLHMQMPGVLPSVDLSSHVVPMFDELDRPIPGPNNARCNDQDEPILVNDPPVAETAALPELVDSSNTASSAIKRTWRKAKRIALLMGPNGTGQTPRILEEAVEVETKAAGHVSKL